ncbi:TetR/AcrR family transcriptional regulator [Enterococcus crotali]|uniref:TetR/AcrR family transcriptional regulator n=1 Tax=Enterococcus crotali TaxID=1453587 RepID=UPI00046E66F3|nr:TetR/AcrR family transcriptional regulator [Enterococcus crotali]
MKGETNQKTIENATLELLKTKSIENLSITEIAKHAFISRVTFYSYFDNKYEVVASIEAEFLKGVKQLQNVNTSFLFNVDMESVTAIKEVLYQNSLDIITYYYQKKDIIEVLISENSGITLVEDLYNLYYDHFKKALPDLFYFKFSTESLKFYTTFMTKGAAAIVEEWILTGFKQSIDFITDSILNMLAMSLNNLYCDYKKNEN